MDWKENVGTKERNQVVRGTELEGGKTAVSSEGESTAAKTGLKKTREVKEIFLRF